MKDCAATAMLLGTRPTASCFGRCTPQQDDVDNAQVVVVVRLSGPTIRKMLPLIEIAAVPLDNGMVAIADEFVVMRLLVGGDHRHRHIRRRGPSEREAEGEVEWAVGGGMCGGGEWRVCWLDGGRRRRVQRNSIEFYLRNPLRGPIRRILKLNLKLKLFLRTGITIYPQRILVKLWREAKAQ